MGIVHLLRAFLSLFGSDVFGLSVCEFVSQGKCENINWERPPSQKGSSLSSDKYDEELQASEQAVFQAIQESEKNLLKLKEENPDAFEFLSTQISSPDATDSSDKKPLSWQVDFNRIQKGDKVHNGSSKLPVAKKSTQISQESKAEWKKDTEVLKNVDRTIIPQNTAEPHMIGANRKVLDIQRWYCISRAQYKKSCGLSSLVSCWNYMYSTLGRGSLKPITQEEALVILGFRPDFSNIKFGPFTGNTTLMRWFHCLNEFYGVTGRAYFLYKPKGSNKTLGVSSDKALSRLKEGLRRSDCTYIYHCSNHYFCPIGYDDTPTDPRSAYSTEILPSNEKECWILIGDTSKNHPSIHSVRWEDIVEDLNMGNPHYLDIRRMWKGMQTREKADGGNLHCIIAFEKSIGVKSMTSKAFSACETQSEEDSEDPNE